VRNLTRDWVNTTSLWARNTNCKGRGKNEAPACHQLHYGWDNCDRVPDGEEGAGTAVCQRDISPAEVLEAIDAAYVKTKELVAA